MKHQPDSIHNEQGMSLVEILGAVTIMSIITVFLMGYLVSAIETSSEQNRRLIAANLARLKIAEVREVFEDGSRFADLLTEFQRRGEDRMELTGEDTVPHLSLQPETINDTDYRYMVAFDIGNSTQKGKLDAAIGVSRDYLIPVSVTVYWTYAELGYTSERYSVTIPSYVVKMGG